MMAWLQQFCSHCNVVQLCHHVLWKELVISIVGLCTLQDIPCLLSAHILSFLTIVRRVFHFFIEMNSAFFLMLNYPFGIFCFYL